MKFCGQCGISLGRACSVCGFINPANYRFCGQCGTHLVGDPVTAIPEQPAEIIPAAQITLPLPLNGSPDQTLHSEIRLEGERRIVTVLVTDVTGSTELLEKVGSETWVDLMNHILHIKEGEIYRFGGEVDQFRGDGLVAFFGASLTHEDDPERSVLAALSMQREIKK